MTLGVGKSGESSTAAKPERGSEPWRLRLAQALKDRGLEYSAVSEGVGRNKDYVSRLVNGRANPTVEVLQEICDFSGVDFIWLFAKPENVNEAEIVERVGRLSEDEAQLVSRLIRSARS